jgi:hypothetical protein
LVYPCYDQQFTPEIIPKVESSDALKLSVSFNLDRLRELPFPVMADTYALLGERLRLAQQRLNETYTYFPLSIERPVIPAAIFNWMPFAGDSLSPPSCVFVTPHTLHEWQLWWLFDEFRNWRAEDFCQVLAEAGWLLNETIRLALKKFARPQFPHRVTLKEKIWIVLHGSHPPKEDAGSATCSRRIGEGVLRAVC